MKTKIKKLLLLSAVVMIFSVLFCFSTFGASYPLLYPNSYSVTANAGDVVSIGFTIYHEYKNEKITSVVYDKDGSPLASAEQSFYPSSFSTDYTLNWDTSDYPAGEYTVISRMSYYSLGQWNDAPKVVTVNVTLEGEIEKSGETVGEAIILNNDEWHIKNWTNKNYSRNCYNMIVLPSRGYITFAMKKLYNDGKLCTVDLSLHDENGKAIWVCDTGGLMKDSFSETCEYKIGLDSGTYYMNITPNFYVSSGKFEFEYKYSFTEADNWEIESNNTVENATEITLDKAYNGVFCEEYYSLNYQDNYSFKLKKGHEYRIAVDNYAELSEGTLIVGLYDPDGVNTYSLGNGKTSGNSHIWSFVAGKSGTYIFKLSNETGDIPVEYTIKVLPGKHSYTEKLTKAATCKEKGIKTFSCSCGDTYTEEIGFGNHTEVTLKAVKPTYTKTGLTEGKKCKTCGKVTVKQKKVAKKKLKKVTISSVKSTKKKTALVGWKKVTDASGYIVEYSTSKKFTKKTTKTVKIKKGKTTKTTLKKLKSGKKYYVRIRAYKTVSKKTVYGSYSSVKTVKIK